MPHPIRIDQSRAGRVHRLLHHPVDMFRHTREHECRRGSKALCWPVAPDEIVIATDATGCDDDCTGMQREVVENLS